MLAKAARKRTWCLLATGLFLLAGAEADAGGPSVQEPDRAELLLEPARVELQKEPISPQALSPRRASRSVRDEPAPRPELIRVERTSGERQQEMEMPWIWRRCRRIARSKLPEHREEGFRAVLAPTFVTGPTDTTPGVGVAGHF